MSNIAHILFLTTIILIFGGDRCAGTSDDIAEDESPFILLSNVQILNYIQIFIAQVKING